MNNVGTFYIGNRPAFGNSFCRERDSGNSRTWTGPGQMLGFHVRIRTRINLGIPNWTGHARVIIVLGLKKNLSFGFSVAC